MAVITDVFLREARYQADTSGMRDFRPIVVPHPTSHLPEDEIQALATANVERILSILFGTPS